MILLISALNRFSYNREISLESFKESGSIEYSADVILGMQYQGMERTRRKNAFSLEEAKALQAQHGGFIKTMWCGELACELKMKEEAGMTSRCIPFAQEHLGDTCPICGRAAKKMIYWGVAY